ncbi:MAG: hypothetical protein K0S08_1442 [Gammaproteobacteria bacterium]|jgi:hypothetical protein|nr:hypothetical protein [Gammaproteobacteria bacterium]
MKTVSLLTVQKLCEQFLSTSVTEIAKRSGYNVRLFSEDAAERSSEIAHAIVEKYLKALNKIYSSPLSAEKSLLAFQVFCAKIFQQAIQDNYLGQSYCEIEAAIEQEPEKLLDYAGLVFLHDLLVEKFAPEPLEFMKASADKEITDALQEIERQVSRSVTFGKNVTRFFTPGSPINRLSPSEKENQAPTSDLAESSLYAGIHPAFQGLKISYSSI